MDAVLINSAKFGKFDKIKRKGLFINDTQFYRPPYSNL